MELPRSTLTSGNNTATNGPQKLPLEIRSAIVTLHFAADQSWSEISAHLKVDPGTAQRVCERAKVGVIITPPRTWSKSFFFFAGTGSGSYGY